MQFINETASLEEANGKLVLDESHEKLITTYIRRYLNVLETIAASWRHKISDAEIIQEEFRTIFLKDGKNQFRLETFRLATGIYPSISEICKFLVEAQQPKPGKRPTGRWFSP